LSAWAAYNNAALIQAFPATSTAFGRRGDRLPFSSRVSGNVGIDQEFPLTGNIRGFAGGSVSYVGDRQGVFTSTANRQNFPSYARTDLRAGLKRHSWTVNLFINNAADRRAALNGGIGTLSPIAFNYIQPRTIGISNGGVPTVNIVVPVRYTHAHNGIMDRSDFDQTVTLVVALIKRLDAPTVKRLRDFTP
jgi:iron complex outermembrane recepter protein